ncbi:hypothetical protein SUGI_0212900 [Cryptomeria japonica]|nr:hypothetical protein SUGI_0212900 [Cryptomeria japonica]
MGSKPPNNGVGDVGESCSSAKSFKQVVKVSIIPEGGNFLTVQASLEDTTDGEERRETILKDNNPLPHSNKIIGSYVVVYNPNPPSSYFEVLTKNLKGDHPNSLYLSDGLQDSALVPPPSRSNDFSDAGNPLISKLDAMCEEIQKVNHSSFASQPPSNAIEFSELPSGKTMCTPKHRTLNT